MSAVDGDLVRLADPSSYGFSRMAFGYGDVIVNNWLRGFAMYNGKASNEELAALTV